MPVGLFFVSVAYLISAVAAALQSSPGSFGLRTKCNFSTPPSLPDPPHFEFYKFYPLGGKWNQRRKPIAFHMPICRQQPSKGQRKESNLIEGEWRRDSPLIPGRMDD